MSRSETAMHVLAAPLLVALSACVLLVPVATRIDRMHASSAEVGPDLVYFSSPRLVKMMALGYDSLLADVYWMRAIQYYGRRDEAARRPVRYGNLPLLLDIATTLDPDLLHAYRAGSSFLAEPDPIGAGQPQAALELLEKGIKQHPVEWRFHFDKGFVYFWFVQDARKAGETWLAASRIQGAPAWMGSLAAMALSRGGDIDTARALWRRQYLESERTDVKANARNHLDSMQVNEDVWTLELFVSRYTNKTGSRPAELENLVRAGLIQHIPRDPSGEPYAYDRVTGKVRLSARTRVRYVQIPYDYREAFLARLGAKSAD